MKRSAWAKVPLVARHFLPWSLPLVAWSAGFDSRQGPPAGAQGSSKVPLTAVMHRCRLVVFLVLLATVGLGAQSLDLTAGAGAGLGGNFKHGFWPSFSATGWIDQNLGFEGGIAFNVGGAVRNYAAEGNLAVRAAAQSWTPEFLLGYARLQTALPKCSLCLINPLAPAAFSLPKYNTFDLGVAVKHYVSGGAFFVARHFLPWSLPLVAWSADFDSRQGPPAGAQGSSKLPPQADFRTYFGGGSEFGQPWRFAFSIGYTIGKH